MTLDAVIPVFPSESLLTTASNLAAQDGSTISLWRLIAADRPLERHWQDTAATSHATPST